MRVFAATHTPEETLKQFNKKKEVLTIKERSYERKRNDKLDAIDWTPGQMTGNVADARNKTTTFMKIEGLLPPAPKSLKEARGYVVADYQDHLEKEWVKELRRAYDVKVNKRVFNSLVKKK